MKINPKHPCYNKSKLFGENLEHTFKYINKEKRKCIVCGEQEIYFGISRYGGYEDWRPKL